MPNLTTLISKVFQLDALRDIFQHASKCYSNLSKKKDQINTLLRSLNTIHYRGLSLNLNSMDNHSNVGGRVQSYYQ